MKDAEYEAILERMLSTIDGRTDSSLARAIGVTPQSISDAKKKGKIPPAWAIALAELNQVSLDWLWFGRGEKRLQNTAANENYEFEKRIAFLEGRLEEKQAMIDRLLKLSKCCEANPSAGASISEK